jgi:hypothetical protein
MTPPGREKDRMKVLLIEPATAPLTMGSEDVHIFEPHALEYLAAPLTGNHDVKILDLIREIPAAFIRSQR